MKREVTGETTGYFVVLCHGIENKRYEFFDLETEDKALSKAQYHVSSLLRRQLLVAQMNKDLIEK
jgi:hypothetical protein